MPYRIIQTGIPGLDKAIGGGFTRPGLVYIVGHPGTGKTIMCIHYAYNRAIKHGEKTKYLTLSEPKDLLIQRIKLLKFDKLDEFLNEYLSLEEAMPLAEYRVIISVIEHILEDISKGEYANLIIDSLSSLVRGLSPQEVANILQMIFKEITGKDITTIIVGEIPLFAEIKLPGVEEFMADVVIRLDYIDIHGERLAVRMTPIKMRIGAIDRKYYEVAVDERGFNVVGELPSRAFGTI